LEPRKIIHFERKKFNAKKLKFFLYYLSVFSATTILIIALLLFAASVSMCARYGYSTNEMGRDAFGFYSGFSMMGFVLMIIGISLGFISKRMWKKIRS
jgi:hypothetical protein